MQTSKFIRFLGLALFFLFPLLSVVQLRDTDGPWRQVAQQIRPSVVTLQQVKRRQPGPFDTFNGIHCAINLCLCPVDGKNDRSAGTAQSAGSDGGCLCAAEDPDRTVRSPKTTQHGTTMIATQISFLFGAIIRTGNK